MVVFLLNSQFVDKIVARLQLILFCLEYVFAFDFFHFFNDCICVSQHSASELFGRPASVRTDSLAIV